MQRQDMSFEGRRGGRERVAGVKQAAAPERVNETEVAEQIKALFDERLRGKLDKVPAANVLTDLPTIESITIIPPAVEPVTSLNVTLFYRGENGKERTATVFVSDKSNGMVGGKIPSVLNVTREELSFEILRIIEQLHIEAVHQIDHPLYIDALEAQAAPDVDDLPRAPVTVFPEQDPQESLPRNEAAYREWSRPTLHPERYDLLIRHPDLLFVIATKGNGLRNYFVAVFERVAVFENVMRDNAAFVVSIDKPIDVSEDRRQRPLEERFSDAEIGVIVEKDLKNIFDATRTRQTLVTVRSARRIRHQGQWEDRLKHAIEELSAAA